MEEEKPYLITDLSLQDLADRLNISRHQLSGLINQRHNINFYEFVNNYRVKEFILKMQDPDNQHYKMLSIAYDSGFNSKASFNRIFKQITGQTPSDYKDTVVAS